MFQHFHDFIFCKKLEKSAINDAAPINLFRFWSRTIIKANQPWKSFFCKHWKNFFHLFASMKSMNKSNNLVCKPYFICMCLCPIVSVIDQRFSTQSTQRPVLWRKKFPQPAIEDFTYLQTFLKAGVTLLSTKISSIVVMPATRLKSSTICRLWNAVTQ